MLPPCVTRYALCVTRCIWRGTAGVWLGFEGRCRDGIFGEIFRGFEVADPGERAGGAGGIFRRVDGGDTVENRREGVTATGTDLDRGEELVCGCREADQVDSAVRRRSGDDSVRIDLPEDLVQVGRRRVDACDDYLL